MWKKALNFVSTCLVRLHFLGKLLSVERANNTTENNTHQQAAAQSVKHSSSMTNDAIVTGNLNAGSKLGSFPTSEPIAERFGVGYRFPPHLEYVCMLNLHQIEIFLPTSKMLLLPGLDSIHRSRLMLQSLILFLKVLHLMNKINIPAPFRIALPTPPLLPFAGVPALPSSPPPPSPPFANEPSSTDLSSGESELGSSDERESVVGLADVAHEAVGVRPASLVPKEIPVIKKNPVLQVISVCFEGSSEWANRSSEVEKEQTMPDENLDLKPYLTRDELEGGKLPPEEILSLPMFKNYAAGNPASVLYIKNLEKDVVADDFYFIFGEDWGGLSNQAMGNL
ncbi:hypothetical protein RHSIM_Rhsim03G0115400 [Rhododendron simsii]|uniref:Uncharacterized protein n=1 Tax=Rhododendron simsii TaxID=118357 RepID=A0A834H7Z6_RHOSS|nr:hypothetical protein RHSIM_Rhsim03G0115400 [Rhododendron simsii]